MSERISGAVAGEATWDRGLLVRISGWANVRRSCISPGLSHGLCTYMSFKLLTYLVTGPWMPYAMPRSMNSLAAMFVMTRVAAFWHASVIGGRLTSFKSIAASSTAPPCGRPCVDRQVQVRIG